MKNKKSLKKYVYEKMEKDGYITDQEVFDFRQKENDLITASDYKEQFRRLDRDRKFFADKEIIGIEKWGNRRKRYVVEIERGYYPCCKDFYNEIAPKFKKDFSKHKYIYNGNELYNIKTIKSFSGHEIEANWKNKDNNNSEHLGRFRLSELEIIDL